MTTVPELTVAVVVKNRPAQLARCLAGVLALDPAPEEVVVVDNGSTDSTPEVARSLPSVRVVLAPGPLGLARQAAVDACRTELLAFVDSDCVPAPSWASELVAALTPEIAVVQGRTVPAAPVTARWAATQDIAAFTDRYEACNLLYRVQPLRAAGGFDPRTGFFGEDTAAGWRVRRQGGRGVFAPAAVVAHDVTYPGLVWHLRRGLGYAAWPRLVAEFPELRHEALYRQWFLRRSNIAVLMAVAGAAGSAATRRPGPLVAALPWCVLRRPRRRGLRGLGDSAAGMAFDLAVLAGLVRGSVKERRVVL